MIDYRYLKAFILTAENNSFSKAAAILGIAQSAVSRQIKLLEESLDEELIIRSSKKVLLSERGKELFKISQDFDREANDLFFNEDHRPLRIGCLHGLLENWLNKIIINFYKRYNRNLNIKVDSQPQLKEALEKGFFDIIFTTENIQSELISSLHIMEEKLVLISKFEVDKSKINEYRWVVYSKVDNIFRLSKKPSDSIVTVHSMTSLVNFVKNRVGIAVVPDHVLKPTDNLIQCDLPELGKSEIYMATLNYKTMPSYIKEIANLIKKFT